MIKLNTLTTFLGLVFIASSCTEEVSKELENKLSSSSSSENLTASSIRLTHTMDESLSFSMHKAGTVDDPCELAPADPDGFDASTYYKDPDDGAPNPPQVIDCVLEAQENDLYQQGANYKLEVDAQLCEYVRYKPFKFIEKPYGNTAKTVYQVNCAAEEDDCSTGGYCDKIYDNYDGGGVANATALTNSLHPDNISCQYDYSNGTYGENCDQGEVRYINLYIDNSRYDHDNDANTDEVCRNAVNTYPMIVDSVDIESCGGEHSSCFGGPAVEQLGDGDLSETIYSNTNLQKFVEEWTIEAPMTRYHGDTNMYLANFSRMCADTSAIKLEDGSDDYASYIGLELNGHDYQTLSSGGAIATYNDSGGETDYRAYAEGPWRAYHATKPYYAFECLDQAKDVKAQIRLYIRDWDRTYDAPYASFAYVTDLHTPIPYMDSKDSHDDDDWNDITDWDDWFVSKSVWTSNKCDASANPYSSADFPGHL